MVKGAGLVISAGFILAAAFVPGCIFGPRDAESPDSNGSGGWIPPTSTSKLMWNLRRSVEEQLESDYQRTLADSFSFHPDVADSIDGLSLWGEDRYLNWDYEVEVQVVGRIFTQADSLTLSFSDTTETQEGNHAEREADYELRLKSGGDWTTYKGTARFMLAKVGSEWSLYKWKDQRSEAAELDTWGFLRGENRY
jgi:hypothetical protein